MTALRGAVALAFGLTVLVWQDPGAADVALAFGGVLLVAAGRLRRLARVARPAAPR